MSGFDYPAQTPMVTDDKKPTPQWEYVFTRWHSAVLSVQASGSTADRPTAALWIGYQYFDTTLGKPVWLKSARPNVWVDGVGTPC